MISLGELFLLRFSGGCRFRGCQHVARSMSTAVAATADSTLELEEALTGRCLIPGELDWKHGPRRCLEETAANIDNHLAIVRLSKGVGSLPYDRGNAQVTAYSRMTTVGCLGSTSKMEISPRRPGSSPHPSPSEQPSDRLQFSEESKQQGSGSEMDSIGREDRLIIANEDVAINSPGLKVFLGEEVRAESHIVTHVKDAPVLEKHPHVKSRQRRLRIRPVKSHTSTSKSEPGRKSAANAIFEPRRATSVYALNRQISILMDTGYREEAYAVYEKKILQGGFKPDSYTFLHLIKGFCAAGELAPAQELFTKVRKAGDGSFCGKSEVILYNAMVHGLGSAGFVKEALNLVEEMTVRGFPPDIFTYNSILHSLGKAGKVTEALTIHESMAGRGVTPDVVTYNSLINFLGKAGRDIEAYRLFERMIDEDCLPDRVTFNTLLLILGKSRKLDLAMNLYEFMKTMGCRPDIYTYTLLVNGLCSEDRVDEALGLSVEMTEKGCAPNTVTFNSWLNGLCKRGRVVEAHLLFQKMIGLGYVPDNITYCILIDAFSRTGQFVDETFDLLKTLLKCPCVVDSRTWAIVLQSFKKVGMLKQAKRMARNARAKQSRCNGTKALTEIKTSMCCQNGVGELFTPAVLELCSREV